MNMQSVGCILVPLALSAVSANCAERPLQVPFAERKVIKLYGWERPDTAALRTNIELVKRAGFDGLGINVMPNQPIPEREWGKHGNYRWFGAHAYKRDDFTRAVEDLKSTDMGRLTDNFVHVAVRGPKVMGLFHQGWPQVVENARVLSWLCRETGLKGITLDVEDAAPLNYSEGLRDERSFADCVARARQCGREYMSALCEYYADITLFLTHGHWVAADYMDRCGGSQLEDVPYALLPAFIDGLLEGAAEGANVVDGMENTYPLMHYDTFRYFMDRADAATLALTAVPELFRTRMSRALGIWPGFPHDYGTAALSSDPESNHFSPERLKHAIHNALSLSDKYVWLWSGANTWWPVTMPCYDGRQTFPMSGAYRQALAEARQAWDTNWSPLPPDTGAYAPQTADAAVLARIETEYDVFEALPAEWWFKTEPDIAVPALMDEFDGWSNPFFINIDEATAGWRRLRTDKCWEAQGVPYDGVAWYRLKFAAPRGAVGRRAWVCFPRVLGEVKAYAGCEGRGPAVPVDVERAGDMVLIPVSGLVRPGKATFVAVRVYNVAGPGGLAGTPLLVGRKGESPFAAAGRRILLDLDLSEARNGRVADRSGSGNDATVHGTTATAAGLAFDGTGDYLDCGSDMSLVALGTEITWEVVFSPVRQVESGIVYHILAAKHPKYTNGLYLNYMTKPNRLVFHQGTAHGAASFALDDVSKFYHAAATYDGRDMRLYVNGEMVAKKRHLIPPVVNDANLLIGGGAPDTARHSVCVIRLARLYNYCLSSAQVRERYEECGLPKGQAAE